MAYSLNQLTNNNESKQNVVNNKSIDEWNCQDLFDFIKGINLPSKNKKKMTNYISENKICGADINSLQSSQDVYESFPGIDEYTANQTYRHLLMVSNRAVSKSMGLIQLIDEAIGRYYILKGTYDDINKYFNTNDRYNKGKFFSFCQKYGINDDNIQEKIEQQLDCVLIAFDDNVPGAGTKETVYELIKRCYLSCKNEQTSQYERKQYDDEYKQECLIVPNKDRRRPIHSSPNKDDALIKCIGSLSIEYTTGITNPPEKSIGTGTVIHIDSTHYCYVLTAAHNARQILRECVQCHAKTIKSFCDCGGKTEKTIPATLIKADVVQFERRCTKQEINVNNEIFRFGQIMQSYQIDDCKVRDNLYKTFSKVHSGYDLCIMRFKCKDLNEISFYKLNCSNIELVCDPFLGVSESYFSDLKLNGIPFDEKKLNKTVLNIYGYPSDKYDGSANNKRYQMYGMSTSPMSAHKMTIERNKETGKSYISNLDIDTTPGQSGACIYASVVNDDYTQTFTIYGVHSGNRARRTNVATYLDSDNLTWIQQQIYANKNKNKISKQMVQHSHINKQKKQYYVFDNKHGDRKMWKFTNENKCIKGNDILFGWYYCVYLSLACESKHGGVYSVSVQYVNGLHFSGYAPCCFGVTSKQKKSHGVWYSKRWPNMGSNTAYSYFDGLYEKPYWKKSETITIKLDLNAFMVSYYKSGQLIKKQCIPKRKRYYFMMSANAHKYYKFEYSINC